MEQNINWKKIDRYQNASYDTEKYKNKEENYHHVIWFMDLLQFFPYGSTVNHCKKIEVFH